MRGPTPEFFPVSVVEKGGGNGWFLLWIRAMWIVLV